MRKRIWRRWRAGTADCWKQLRMPCFFQAEDGIRYPLVTGVQTCALPIFSGSGGQLSEALVRNEFVDCLAFVGGKTNGGVIASTLYDEKKRYMLEMEGVNTYGVWQFSNWPLLAEQLRKGFDYGKQRCTAYVRFVVQRELFPQFQM